MKLHCSCQSTRSSTNSSSLAGLLLHIYYNK